MKPAVTHLRSALNLLLKFRSFLVVCLAVLSIPVAAYLNSQTQIVSANSPGQGLPSIDFRSTRGYTFGDPLVDPLMEPIQVAMGGGTVWNTPFKVPVMVGDLTGYGVRSFIFHVRHDPGRLTTTAVPFEVHGTLSEGMTITSNVVNPSHIIISGTSTNDLSGAGTLIYLKFQSGAPPGLGSMLAFEDYIDPQENFYPAFRFNDGSPSVVTSNGGVSFFWPIQGTMTPTPPPTATPSLTPTPEPTPCDLSFDSVNPPVLPGDWSVWSPWHPNYANYFWSQWKTSNIGPDTLPNAVFAPALWSDETMRLTSASYFVPPTGSGEISFRNSYDTEYAFDGMVLEMSINGGAFQDIVDAGGTFSTGGYNSIIGTGYNSTIEGSNAWSGNSNGYITTTIQLPPSAVGQFIRLAWVMATDTSVSGNGVRIDTITGLQCFDGSTPTPTPTVNPTATPTFTPTPTPFFPGSLVLFARQVYWGNDETTQPTLIEITRINQTNIFAGVTLTTLDSSAVGGTSCDGTVDFISSVQQLTFAPGETTKFAAVTVCGDSSSEGLERVDLKLSGNDTRPTIDAAVLFISDNEGAAFDYEADGRSDISVFRPSTGTWYIQRSTGDLAAINFGNSTDKIVPADYDGDGKTDVAVFRPSERHWYIASSLSGTFTAAAFGNADDILTPADYDGDGKADLAVFRPSTGTWFIAKSANPPYTGNQLIINHFGTNGDEPTIGDFDGDRKADIAVFRPSNGYWYRANSSDGSIHAEHFGIATDRIVPADYDGDRKIDIAVYRPSEGIWYIKNSAAGTYSIVNFGLSEDIPSPGDFDGDGKTDIAVFRPSNGTWYISNSSNGSYTFYQFGLGGDIPTQSAFGN